MVCCLNVREVCAKTELLESNSKDRAMERKRRKLYYKYVLAFNIVLKESTNEVYLSQGN